MAVPKVPGRRGPPGGSNAERGSEAQERRRGLTGDRLVTYGRPVTEDDDRVFKALADPTRRFLLDRLFARDGRTLTELESELAMTRFGVMKHLRVLEEAGLVVTRRQGREKLHFLNPVPIRLVHDRWIDKYTERRVSALAELKAELEKEDLHDQPTDRTATTQVYRVYIKATPEAIWDAITKPEWTERYGYGGRAEFDLRPGGAYRGLASEAMRSMGAPEVAVDGEVVEADPPHRLVQTFRMRLDRRRRRRGSPASPARSARQAG